MTRTSLVAMHGALALLALIVASLLVGTASANDQGDKGGEIVRIIARLQKDGDIEFGLRVSGGDQFPRGRIFSSAVSDDRWKRSTPVILANGATVRIIARRIGDTRVEFALRIDELLREFLPTRRVFSRSTPVGAWRVSSPLLIPAPADVGDDDASAEPTDPDPEQPAATPDERSEGSAPGQSEPQEIISGGHRDGLIVDRNIVGDPNAPALIVEYGDPF